MLALFKRPDNPWQYSLIKIHVVVSQVWMKGVQVAVIALQNPSTDPDLSALFQTYPYSPVNRSISSVISPPYNGTPTHSTFLLILQKFNLHAKDRQLFLQWPTLWKSLTQQKKKLLMRCQLWLSRRHCYLNEINCIASLSPVQHPQHARGPTATCI